QAGLTAQLDYLKKLAAVRGADGSRFVSLYLGRTLLEIGSSGDATKYLERFSTQTGVEPRYKATAEAELGLCHFLRKDASKARALWAALDTADPDVQVALAAVYSKAGLKERDPVAMADAALRKVGASPSRRRPVSAAPARRGPGDVGGIGPGEAGRCRPAGGDHPRMRPREGRVWTDRGTGGARGRGG